MGRVARSEERRRRTTRGSSGSCDKSARKLRAPRASSWTALVVRVFSESPSTQTSRSTLTLWSSPVPTAQLVMALHADERLAGGIKSWPIEIGDRGVRDFPSTHAMSTLWDKARGARRGWRLGHRAASMPRTESRHHVERGGILLRAWSDGGGGRRAPDEKRFGFGRRDPPDRLGDRVVSTGLGPEGWTRRSSQYGARCHRAGGRRHPGLHRARSLRREEAPQSWNTPA